jgi:nitrogen-specific signal transduction histidine kinase
MFSNSLNKARLAKYELTTLGLMLVTLHIALNQTDILITSTLLLMHLGFFLFWQPLFSSKETVNNKSLLFSILIIFGLYYFLNWWFIALWIILLIGLTGGSALIQGMSRTVYALAAVILFLELSLTITPSLFHLQVLSSELDSVIYYSMLLASLVITLWPNKQHRIVRIDYLHSMIISFGSFALYQSSILVSFTYKQNYIEALLTTAFLLGVFLLLVSLLWLPKRGISGLGQKWEQHILNIGNPFEKWVHETALLGKNKKLKPEVFLQFSVEHLLNLPWVSGISWQSATENEFHGTSSKHIYIFEEDSLKMELHSHIPMGSALKIHAQLLMQLLSYFYQSKLREITLKNQTHLKAVYETGSKLTHDIKNILQALQTLTGVVQASDNPQQSHELLEKQLPLLTQRLQNTLDKLQAKTDTGQNFKLLSVWWKELKSRYHGRDINFEGTTEKDIEIDTDIFDTILENLLENARSKRRDNPETDITATIFSSEKNHFINVCDSGDPVPDNKSNILFNQILPSKDGYGIGLYQSAQLARKNNYQLTLSENKKGKVCFSLFNGVSVTAVPQTLSKD